MTDKVDILIKKVNEALNEYKEERTSKGFVNAYNKEENEILDIMLERIKNYIEIIKKGDYDISAYSFTIELQEKNWGQTITFKDDRYHPVCH